MVREFRGQPEKTRLDRLAQAFGRTRLGGWLGITVIPAIDRHLIPLTRGRMQVAIGQPMLLLHTRGARSGLPRTSPLLYTLRNGCYVVVASKAGAQHHPAWYHNLRAYPDAVTVEIRGRRTSVHPRIASGDERDELWRVVNDNYNGYDVYQRRAGGRTIPVVILVPESAAAPPPGHAGPLSAIPATGGAGHARDDDRPGGQMQHDEPGGRRH